METESEKETDRILTLRYINGKSYKWLKQYLTREGYNENEAIKKLNQIDILHSEQRFKRANKDLLISFIFISLPLSNFLLYYFDIIIIKFGIIEIACLFAFRPFLTSYYRVIRDKSKFKVY